MTTENQSPKATRRPFPMPVCIRREGPIVSPLDAQKTILEREAAEQLSVPSMASNTVDGPASVTELARALKNDVDLIYEWVYDNIDYTPTYGVKKGALGTLVDGSGNSFDQCMLMAALLRQAGYVVNYELGALVLNGTQLANFLGTDPNDPGKAVNIFAQGGIPVTYNVDTTTGAIISVSFAHMWLNVNIGGQIFVFDPAFKTYNRVTGINLAAATGFTASDLLSSGPGGAEQGTTITSNSIQNVNTANLRSKLATYSTNLVNYIKTNMPAARVDDVLGGKTIVPTTGQLRQSFNPNQDNSVPVLEFTGDVPDTYRTTLRVQFLGIDQTFNSDAIYGHRLTIFWDGPTANAPVLRLDGTTVATGNVAPAGSVNFITFTVTNKAYPSNFADTINQQGVLTGESYLIANSWGQTSRNMVEYHRSILEQNQASGLSSTSEPVLGEALAVQWATWTAESTITSDIVDRLTNCTVIWHHQVGAATYNQTPGFDLGGLFQSTAQRSSTAMDPTIAFEQISLHNSMFESTVITQLNGIEAVSTIRMFDVANSAGVIIFDANSSNWFGAGGIRSQLVNYATSDLDNFEQTYINNGFRLLIPQNGQLVDQQWQGWAALPYKTTAAATLISGGLKGGSGAVPNNGLAPNQKKAGKNPDGTSNTDPVDMLTGNYVHGNEDLVVGSVPAPYSLVFTRLYNSASKHNNAVGLGLGWTHSFAFTATQNSDGFQGLGEDSAIDAAAAISELFVSLSLVNGSTEPLSNIVVSILAQSWLMDQLTHNAVVVSSADGSQLFVKLSDGTYNPAPNSAAKLTQNADGTYTCTTARQVKYNFNSAGQIATVVYPYGVTLSFAYNTGGQLITVGNGIGRTLSLSYTGSSLTSVSDGTGRSVTYTFDGSNNLTTFTDALAHSTTYGYDQPGRLTQIFKPANPTVAWWTNVYDSLSRVKTQTDAHGNVWNFRFAGSRSEQDDPAGNARVRYFDALGNITRDIDGVGNQTTNVYDGLGRLVQKTLPLGNGYSYTYDGNNNVVTETRLPAPNASGPSLSPTTRHFTWHPVFNKVTSLQDANGNLTTLSYDTTTGLLTHIQRPLSQRAYTYTSRGQVATIVDENGVTTSFTYDATTEALLTAVFDPAGAGNPNGLNLTTGFGYDSVGNRTSITDPNGKVWSYVYDSQRRLTQETGPTGSGIETQYVYDASGNTTSVQKQTGGTPSTQTFSYTFGPADETVTSTDPLGHVSTYSYDTVGRLHQVTDAASRITTFTYDANSRLLTVTDATGAVSRTNTYNANGSIATVTDGDTNLTQYVYDGFNRLYQIAYPNSTFEAYEYDANDNITFFQNRTAVVTLYSYDGENRKTSSVLENEQQASSETYTYDALGRMLTATKSPVSSTDPSTGTYTFQYNRAGRLAQETTPDGLTRTYQYDSIGHLVQLGGTGLSTPVTYTYDLANRLSSMTFGNASSSVTVSYDALSRRTQLSYSNGAVEAISFDLNNNPTSVTHTFATGSGVSFTHGYDNVDQETSQGVSDGTFMWHPASLPIPTTTVYTIAPEPLSMNQYTSVGGNAVAYDANGNMIQFGAASFVYDVFNRLIQATNSSGTTTFAYDPLGRQATSVNPSGAALRFLDTWQVACTQVDKNTASVISTDLFVPGTDLVVARLDATGNVTFVHTDKRGSMVATTDSSGAVLNRFAYSPFGESAGIAGTSFGFTGQRLDANSGLYFYKSRFYMPAIGRFLQPDPVGYKGGLNLYTYAKNNPLNLVDPLGTQPFPAPFRPPVVPVQAEPIPGTLRPVDVNLTGMFGPNLTSAPRDFPVISSHGGAGDLITPEGRQMTPDQIRASLPKGWEKAPVIVFKACESATPDPTSPDDPRTSLAGKEAQNLGKWTVGYKGEVFSYNGEGVPFTTPPTPVLFDPNGNPYPYVSLPSQMTPSDWATVRAIATSPLFQ